MVFSFAGKLLRFFIFIVLVFVVVQILTIAVYSKRLSLTIEPYQKIIPQSEFKVVFLGDSTAVGTGASSSIYSTAGWFSRDFPEASVENYSRNGLRFQGLIDILGSLKDKHYDLAILQIGANDIVYFTSLPDIEKRQKEVLSLAKNIADQVIILHSGNIGDVPLFYWPLNSFYTWRSNMVREIYRKSQDDRVAYVDIIELEKTIENPRQNYAVDNFHLNDEGWHTWYRFIKTKLPPSTIQLNR